MPLKTGRSNKVVSANISEMMGSYKKKGTLGTSKPKSAKKAQKQAVAIALQKAGKSRKMAEGGVVKPKITYVKRKDADRKVMIA